MPANCLRRLDRDEGPRLGSRRAGCTPGRWSPVRRCIIPAPSGTEGIVPPLRVPRAAMLAAATRSRCPPCPQCGHRHTLPAGLGTRWAHAGHVEDVPRSLKSSTAIPATSALSARTKMSWPGRQLRTRPLCTRPDFRSKTPRGSPTTNAPTRLSTAHSITCFAASCWACRIRRRYLASALRSARRCFRQRRDPRSPRFGARLAAARLRPLRSRRC